MPVIVVGADTILGSSIIDRLVKPEREVRAFVTDPREATRLKKKGVKVALGDVSDESHVEAAALRCFSAVLVTAAAEDARERSFGDTPDDVLAGWVRAVARSKVKRVIWVTDRAPPTVELAEVAIVEPDHPDVATRVAQLDDAQEISSPGAS